MARHLFIAQQTLATWMDQDKIDFDGDLLTIRSDGRQFSLVEAVRFIKVEGDDEDINGLLGKVKTNEQLEQLGAERYRDSVIHSDVAYRVQEGFIGEIFIKKAACEEAANEAPNKATNKATGESKAKSQAQLQVAQTVRNMPVVEAGKAKSSTIKAAEKPSVKAPPKKPAPAQVPAAQCKAADPAAKPDPGVKAGKVAGKVVGKENGKENGNDLSDEELLTRFLLKNL
jgi:hypothetical protein